MVIRSGVVSLFVLFSAVPCFADESGARVEQVAQDDAGVRVEPAHDRVGVYGMGGVGLFNRSSGGSGGYSFGGELAYAFRGGHGIRFGYALGLGIFGPTVNAFDLDYGYQWNTHPHVDGITLSGGVLLGPAIGIVDYGGNDPQTHASFGGRAGGFFDVNFWMVTVGLDASYRFGFASGFGAEGYATLGLHAGITLELPHAKNPYGT